VVEAIDTTTATGQFFFQVTGSFALGHLPALTPQGVSLLGGMRHPVSPDELHSTAFAGAIQSGKPWKYGAGAIGGPLTTAVRMEGCSTRAREAPQASSPAVGHFLAYPVMSHRRGFYTRRDRAMRIGSLTEAAIRDGHRGRPVPQR
jgi:hypothetical protein